MSEDTRPETPMAKKLAFIHEAVVHIEELRQQAKACEDRQRLHQASLERLTGHVTGCMVVMFGWLILITVWALLPR